MLMDGTALGVQALPPEYGGCEPGTEVSRIQAENAVSGMARTDIEDEDEGWVDDPVVASRDEAGAEPELSLAEMEKRHIMRTLEGLGYNRTRAARALRIGRRTLQRKLDEYREQGEEIPQGAPD